MIHAVLMNGAAFVLLLLALGWKCWVKKYPRLPPGIPRKVRVSFSQGRLAFPEVSYIWGSGRPFF